MNLYIDIETLPTDDLAVIAEIAGSIKAPGTLKKQESIDAWMAENKESATNEAVHKTGFNGLYGRICCICYAFDDGPVFSVNLFDSGDEKTMLESFYSHVHSLTVVKHHDGTANIPVTVIGHNVAAFDLPFIKHRSIINQVKPIPAITKAMNAKPWDSCIADTMLMWSSDREKRASMDKLCRALGIEGKGDFDGSMVAATWPVDPQKVIDYCVDDVARTRAMYKLMTFQFADDSSLANSPAVINDNSDTKRFKFRMAINQHLDAMTAYQLANTLAWIEAQPLRAKLAA